LATDGTAQEVFSRAEKLFAPQDEGTDSRYWLTSRRDPEHQCLSLMPHVSLAYAEQMQSDHRNEVNTSNLPETLLFGAVKVVMPAAEGENPGDWANIIRSTKPVDVRRWNVIYSRLLLGRELLAGSRRTLLHTVISGGQEGTDQAALNAARNVPHLAI